MLTTHRLLIILFGSMVWTIISPGCLSGSSPGNDAGSFSQDSTPLVVVADPIDGSPPKQMPQDAARQAACSLAAPTGVCPSGQACLGGQCCSANDICGGICCQGNGTCISDSVGNRRCAPACNSNRDCPTQTPCCSALLDRARPGQFLSYGACTAEQAQCRCATGTECALGTCAPILDGYGNPTGPYACAPNSCSPYTGCRGLGICPNGYCDLCTEPGNCFCARTCQNATMCGEAQCVRYPISNGSCANGQPACAPR